MKWCQQHCLNSRSLKKATDIYKQLTGYLKPMGIHVNDQTDELSSDPDGTRLRRSLTSGLFMHAAIRQADGGAP